MFLRAKLILVKSAFDDGISAVSEYPCFNVGRMLIVVWLPVIKKPTFLMVGKIKIITKPHQNHFKKALKQRLPLYESAFKHGAKAYNHDWQVLAVISYQESHLNPDAISRTGVEGLMMLTKDTAKAMGVKNRTDAMQSIQGGAKYLEVLEKLYVDVPAAERLWFVLASYNMGPNAVKRIQSELHASGRDGNSWAEVYGYLAKNASKNSRYVQCMHYVANIRTYLETIKTMKV